MSFLAAFLRALSRKPDLEEARALAEANRRLDPLPLPDDYWFDRAEQSERERCEEEERRSREAPFAEELTEPRDEIEGFVWFGRWLPTPQSSHVRAIRYLRADQVLEVEYGRRGEPSVFWGYGEVTPQEAEDIARAASKGVWLWDHVRVRGTVHEHQRPAWFISGPSGKQPGWMKTAGSRKRHGKEGRH